VLLVENDIGLGTRIEQALQTRGYRTRWISDGNEAAVALADEAPIAGPLLLLGGHPPDLGTPLHELMARAATHAGYRVILLPGYAPEPMIADALAASEVESVSGPLDLAALMQRVRRAEPGSG
jgi:DNA-binding NtrC family response regulator